MSELLANLTSLGPMLAFFGCVMILIGVLGGGVAIKEISVPRIQGWVRLVCVGFGIALVAAAVTAAQGPDGPFAGRDPKPAPRPDTRAPQLYDTGHTFYRVCNVRDDDPDGGLNVRELAGVTQDMRFHEVIGVIPPNQRGVKYLGQRHQVGKHEWYQVSWGSVSGWVNAVFLCPNVE